jgi:hypothetical protein
MCSFPILLPLRFRLLSVDGKADRREEISSLVSISWDLASMARLR